MTAKGKITASEIGKRPLGSVRILITDDRAGRAATDPTGDGPWYPAYNKTGMVAATVTDVGYARGNRRSRIDLVTDRGEVNDLSPSQTFWLAPAAPTVAAAPAPAAATPMTYALQASDNGGTTWRMVATGLSTADADAHRTRTTRGEGITWRLMPETDAEWTLRAAAADASLAGGRERLAQAPSQRAANQRAAAVQHLEAEQAAARTRAGLPAADVPAAPDRITVKQLQDTQGVRVLLVDRHNQYAGGGAGEWTAARTAPPRGDLYVKGERVEVHAATVIEVRRVAGTYGSRYDVVTNLGTVERVTAAQAFRFAPASMRDTADMRAESRADIEQREARTAQDLADLQCQIAESDAKAVRDRAEARQFLAEIAPEPASNAPSDRVRIERHRGSVTQGSVSVFLDGELLARYGDRVELCNVGHEPGSHEDGAVCFGGFCGLPDAYWYEVANRIAARRALVEPVYTAAARAGVDFHALAGTTRTVCNWSTRTGQIRERAAVVAEHGSKPCTDCYPVAVKPNAALFLSDWLTYTTAGK